MTDRKPYDVLDPEQRFVGGIRRPKNGPVYLSEKQAEYDLRQKNIALSTVAAPDAEAVQQPEPEIPLAQVETSKRRG